MRTLTISFLFLISSLGLFAQKEEPSTPTQPENPFLELEQMFQGFQFDNMGDGMMIDTMIIRQFGNSDLGNAEMDQMMQEMMQMMMQQMQSFDFGDMQGFDFGGMPDFDQLFEELELKDLEGIDTPTDPAQPNADPKAKKKVKKKKRKTYTL